MRCKTRRLSCVVAGFVALSSGVASAYPLTAPLWGPSGLGVMPTTDCVSPESLEVGLGYERVTPTGEKVRFSPVISATVGMHSGELGAGWLQEHVTAGPFTLDTSFNVLHAKYKLWGNKPDGPALAAGWHYLEFHRVTGHVNSFYLTGSYPLWGRPEGWNLRGHAGVMYNRTTAGDTTNDVRPMVGAALHLTPALSVAADYIGKHHNAARLATVLARYETPSGLGAQVGVGRLAGDHKTFASVTYRFGGQR